MRIFRVLPRFLALLAIAAGALGVDASMAAQSYKLLRLDGKLLKWGGQALGQGARVSYAVADRRLDSPGARNCGAIVAPSPALAKSGIAAARFNAELDAAFAVWARVANITFVRARDMSRADIVIGAQAEPRGAAFTNVAFAPDAGPVAALTRSLICFNPERRWKAGFGGDVDVYDLRYVFIHEIGHAIGLDHSGPSGQVMDFRYSEVFRAPQAGDVDGAVALYGHRAPPPDVGRPRPAHAAHDRSPAQGTAPDLGLNSSFEPRP